MNVGARFPVPTHILVRDKAQSATREERPGPLACSWKLSDAFRRGVLHLPCIVSCSGGEAWSWQAPPTLCTKIKSANGGFGHAIPCRSLLPRDGRWEGSLRERAKARLNEQGKTKQNNPCCDVRCTSPSALPHPTAIKKRVPQLKMGFRME